MNKKLSLIVAAILSACILGVVLSSDSLMAFRWPSLGGSFQRSGRSEALGPGPGTMGPDGTLYVGSTDGRLFAIDPNGLPRWTWSAGGAIYSSPAVGSTGSVYVGSAHGARHAPRPHGPGRRGVTDA